MSVGPIDGATATALAKRLAKAAVFLRIASDPPCRAWSGIGDYPVPADAVETTNDAIYKGVGLLGPLPRLDALVNGRASRVSFSLSGVSTQVLALADADWLASQNCDVDIGIVALDAGYQPAGDVAWIRHGTADQLTIKRQPSSRGIALSVGFGNTDRRRAPLNYWTDWEQQRLSPGDLFCQRVPIYDVGTSVRWPNWGS